jgi:hypothetical protein
MEKVHTRFGDDMVVGIGVGIGIGIEWPLRFDNAGKSRFLIDTDADTDPDKSFVFQGKYQRPNFE